MTCAYPYRMRGVAKLFEIFGQELLRQVQSIILVIRDGLGLEAVANVVAPRL